MTDSSGDQLIRIDTGTSDRFTQSAFRRLESELLGEFGLQFIPDTGVDEDSAGVFATIVDDEHRS